MKRIIDPAHEDQPSAASFITAKEIDQMTFPEQKWVIPNIIPEGLTLLAGKPKIGKSWLCMSLSIANAAGGLALGSISVDQGTVLYLALEDSLRRIKSRQRMLLAPEESPPEQLLYQTLEQARDWNLANGCIDKLRRSVDAHPDTRLIMVDTFKKIRPPKVGTGSDYDRDYEDLIPLQEFSHQSGIGVVVVHHTRKMKGDDVMDEVSGSTGLTGAADTILILTRSRNESDGTLHVMGRDVEEQELDLKKDEQTQRWTLLGEAAEVRRSKERNEILELLRDCKEPKTPKEISEHFGKNHNTTKNLLRKMSDDKEVTSDKGKYSLRGA